MINMIAGTSILILVILLIRKIFWKKCSPNVIYFLWIFVAIRVLLPINIPLELPENSFSKMFVMDSGMENNLENNVFLKSESFPASGTDVGDITDKNEKANIYEIAEDDDRSSVSGIAEEHIQTGISEVIEENTGTEFDGVTNESNKVNVEEGNEEAVLMTIWFMGSFLLALYFLVVNKNLSRNIEKKKIGITEGNIEVFEVEGYNCLCGIGKPQIFLSPEIANNPVYKEYVLMHEVEHYRTKDNFWLLIRTICVTIQWFNPLVWIAYFKMREDCELACDYRVLSKLAKEEKSVYGKALLYILEANQKTVSMACSMGREKNIIKKRIKSIFKKRNAEAYLVPIAVTCIITILAFVQPTIAQETQLKGNGAELINREVAGEEEKTEQVQKENVSDILSSDSEKEIEEIEYEIIVESKKDLERGVNLHYSNCYTTDLKRGSNHYWIDENGVLWGEGTSEYGQLGVLQTKAVKEPVKIAEDVIHVDFSGEYFVIYLTENYELYGLGASPAGILTPFGMWNFNVVDLEVITEPVLLMTQVVYARTGYTSIIVLQENGDVYVLGNNDHIVISNTKYIAPQKVMENAKYVTTYFHTYAVIDENNDLWVWGHNELGQCGIGVYSSNVTSPRKIMENVDCAWMGQTGFNTTDEVKEYDNLVVLKKDGSFVACGEGIGESRFINRVDDEIDEKVEVISTEYFCPAKIKEYNFPSLREACLLWSEAELKEFLENKEVEYEVGRTSENDYLIYVARHEGWKFVFNENGQLADITSYENDELEESRLKEMDSLEKVVECYGNDCKKTDLGYGHWLVEYDREDYDFRILVYHDLGCSQFSKVLKGFYE